LERDNGLTGLGQEKMPAVTGDSVCAPVLTIQLTLAALGALCGLVLGIVKYRSREQTGSSPKS
jgi:hypothetical protein